MLADDLLRELYDALRPPPAKGGDVSYFGSHGGTERVTRALDRAKVYLLVSAVASRGSGDRSEQDQ